MSNKKIVKYGKMALTGELFYRVKRKLSVCFVKNQIIRNNIYEDNEYRRLKKKYYNLIENRPSTNSMKASKKVLRTISAGELK